MHQMFPIMTEEPEKGCIRATVYYWFTAFVSLPLIMVLYTFDIYNRHDWVIWFEIVYHVCNFVFIFLCYFRFMKDSILNVQIQFKQVAKTTALVVFLCLGLKLLMILVSAFMPYEFAAIAALGSLPLAEMDLLYFSGDLLYRSPLWGFICLVFFAPITVSCLYYACCFAPICNERPKLAYAAVALAVLLPRLAISFSAWSLHEEITIYLVQLPIHLAACWAYQKTDTIWTPIAIHTITNLIICICLLFLFGIF